MRSSRPLVSMALLVVVAAFAGSPEAVAADLNDPPASVPLAAPIDRNALTGEILAKWKGEARQLGFDVAAWQSDVRRALDSKSDGALLSIKSSTSWGSVARQLGAGQQTVAPNALGDQTSDLVFFPVAPCRILDTRFGTGVYLGPLAANSTTPVGHNQNLVPQGGNVAGCGIPTDPAAIAVTVVAVGPAAAGDLRLFALLAPEPNASAINYAFVPGLNIANTTIVPTCQICGLDFNIKVDVGATHVVADVVGYFWNPTFANKNGFVWAAAHVTGGATPTVSRSFNNIAGGTAATVTRLGVGTYEVGFGANVSTRFYGISIGNASSGSPPNGSCSATPRATDANKVFVVCANDAGTASDSINFYLTIF